MTEALGDIAAEYAEVMGFSILALKTRSKEPATSNGLHDATNDAEYLREWFNAHPSNNMAIACGEPSGNVIVIDIDRDDDYDGYEVLIDWEQEHGALPDTLSAITGRGGVHLYYRVDKPFRSSVNRELHVDIRGDGSYAMLPPSVHPNGRSVEWENDYAIADADENVLAFIALVRPRADVEHFKLPAVIQIGERNDTLYRFGCSLRAHNLSNEAISASITGANLTCVQPLGPDELGKIIDSVLALPAGYSFQSLVDGEVKLHNIDYENPPDLKPAIIEGVLRKGGVMMLGGASKAGKTFMLMQLAVAIASGTKWLGMQCMQGRVLYIDLEVDEAESDNRFVSVIANSNLTDDELKAAVAGIDIINLRGIITGLEWLLRKLPEIVNGRQYEVIIIDPSYKVIDGDENLAKDVHAFTNNIDKLARMMGSSIIYCHHHSKGAKGDVRSMDRVSGSGVFARHADAVVDCIELEVDEDEREENDLGDATCLRLEFTCRSFKQPMPFETVFKFPVHKRLADEILFDAKPLTGNVMAGRRSGEVRREKMKEDVDAIEKVIVDMLTRGEEVCVADLEVTFKKTRKTICRYISEEMTGLKVVRRHNVNFVEFA